MADSENSGYYALIFSTIDGSKCRAGVTKWFVKPISEVHPYDGPDLEKFGRVTVDEFPWPPKKTNKKESWPHYIVDVGIKIDLEKRSKRTIPPAIKELMYTGKNILTNKDVIAHSEQNLFLIDFGTNLPDTGKRTREPSEEKLPKRRKFRKSFDSDDSSFQEEQLNVSHHESSTVSFDVQRPADYPKIDDPWTLLMYYAVVTLNERFENKTGAVPKEANNFDYIDTFVNMIITSVHSIDLTGKQVIKYSDDYQIVDHNGIIYDSVTCRAKVNELSEAIQEDDRASQHRRRRCKACDGKCACSEATGDVTVRRHIINDVLKCTYICIKCATPLKGKQSIIQHSENCKYRSRVGREAVETRDTCHLYPPIKLNKKQRQRMEKPNPVPIVLSLKDKFAKFCENAFHQLKKDRLLTSKFPNFEGFFEVVTNPVDYTFWLYFKGQVAPTIYFADMTDLQDPGEYYGIYLCNSLTGNNSEPTKSVRCRIFEKCDNHYISMHKLIALRSQLIHEKIRKCNYRSCPCRNKFTVGDQVDMIGHILEYNFLLVCEGCRCGFSSWPQFIEHFSMQCYIMRPVRSDISKIAQN